MKHHAILFGLLCLSALLLTGCDLLSADSRFALEFPDLPPFREEVFAGVPGELVIADPEGHTVREPVERGERTRVVSLRKERGSLVLYYPAVRNGESLLRPYGAVFPGSLDETMGSIRLTAAGGFAAERLFNLVRQGVPVGDFNAERLISLLEDRGGDPYRYDTVVVENDIAAGTFNTYSLDRLPARDATVITGGGRWFTESLYSSLLETTADGLLCIPEVTYGFHRVFCVETGQELDLFLDEHVTLVFSP